MQEVMSYMINEAKKPESPNSEEVSGLKECMQAKFEKQEFLKEQRELGHNHMRDAFKKGRR